jgi:hypothetical protein
MAGQYTGAALVTQNRSDVTTVSFADVTRIVRRCRGPSHGTGGKTRAHWMKMCISSVVYPSNTCHDPNCKFRLLSDTQCFHVDLDIRTHQPDLHVCPINPFLIPHCIVKRRVSILHCQSACRTQIPLSIVSRTQTTSKIPRLVLDLPFYPFDIKVLRVAHISRGYFC